MDSEYVGDSEYAENECATEDELDGDPQEDYPDPPNFEQILANMQGDLSFEENYDSMPRNNHNYSLHPNQYLPSHTVADSAQNSSREDCKVSDEETNGNADNIARDDDDDVIHYGFPRAGKPPQFFSGYTNNLDTNPQDLDYGTLSGIDNMSVSMGGYTSTNASMSDISGLCEIEDSEVNLSDNDSADELGPTAKLMAKYSNSHTHTQV